MISGFVTADLEAVVAIEVRGASSRSATVSAAIDTGFSGSLMLEHDSIGSLELPAVGSGKALLADGRIVSYDIYDGIVIWNGKPRRIEIIATEGATLIGMDLLRGHRLQVDVVDHGAVVIDTLTAMEPPGVSDN